MSLDPFAPLPLLTGNLPGIGGIIKQVPEDFEVEEIPAYEPSGSGGFLYLWIEKRDMGAEYFARQLARRLDIPVGAIGTAGLKDRRAITRQMVSVPEVCVDRLDQVSGDGMELLRVSRHGNKLKPGHLHGNRFRVLVRQPEPEASERLTPLIVAIQAHGLPNYYGPQRFGRGGETVQLGLALLRGDSPTQGKPGRNPFLRKLALSAAQSALFNHYLARRLTDGLFRQVIDGDVLAKWPFGGMFVAQDLAVEQARFDRRETIHTGPMFGRKMFAAAGSAAAREAMVLDDAQLTTAHFFHFGKLLQGTRRHGVIYVDDLHAVAEKEGIRLTFTLPAGSYATILLQELMKCPALDTDE